MCRNNKKHISPKIELADIIKSFSTAFQATGNTYAHHLRTLTAIQKCRSPELGGHVTVCTDCGVSKTSYNSCRNRHCPKCGGFARELWIEDRKRELLPVRYQHIVFTIPEQFNDFCRYNPNFCYSLLFRSAWKTLDTFAKDKKWLGANAGATMVLHTWGQNLMLHPHVHAIVPSGGLDGDGNWIFTKKGLQKSGFLFPVKAMSKVFKAIFLREFMTAWQSEKTPAPTLRSDQKEGHRSLASRTLPTRLDRLRQSPFRWPRQRRRIPRSLHPQDRHLQPPPPCHRPRKSNLPL
jgi:hypothetical protein